MPWDIRCYYGVGIDSTHYNYLEWYDDGSVYLVYKYYINGTGTNISEYDTEKRLDVTKYIAFDGFVQIPNYPDNTYNTTVYKKFLLPSDATTGVYDVTYMVSE